LQHYPTAGEDDIWLPFVHGISPDDEENIPSNIEVIADDGHNKHIRVKGSLAEALAAEFTVDNIA
jgi:hypothetical protein